MQKAFLIQTDKGYRLFDSYQDAENFGGYEKPLEVPKENHYRGKIGKQGILFPAADLSSRIFAVLLAGR